MLGRTRFFAAQTSRIAAGQLRRGGGHHSTVRTLATEATEAAAPDVLERNPLLRVGTTILTVGVTFATSALAYSQYKYDVGEVADKTKELREKAEAEDATAYEKQVAEAAKQYLELREYVDQTIRHYALPSSDTLLPDLPEGLSHVRTLVLDLDELLVHSDWTRERGWRTFKRPGVEIFLQHMARNFEIVVYTEALQTYVDPILERLDKEGSVNHRLYRDATLYTNGEHVRDLSKLNRPLTHIIYLSSKPATYSLHPQNAVPVPAWSSLDPNDRELLELMPFLEAIARQAPPDVRVVVDNYLQDSATTGKDIPSIFRERMQELQAKRQEQTKARFGGGFGQTVKGK